MGPLKARPKASNLSNFPLSSVTSLQTGMGSFPLRYCISSIFFLSRFHGKILILGTLLSIRAGSDVAMGCVAGLVLCYYRIRGLVILYSTASRRLEAVRRSEIRYFKYQPPSDG